MAQSRYTLLIDQPPIDCSEEALEVDTSSEIIKVIMLDLAGWRLDGRFPGREVARSPEAELA